MRRPSSRPARLVLATIAVTLVVAPASAAAATVALRVHGVPNTAALVPRTAVTLPQTAVGTAPNACGPDTAVGALQAAVGASGWAATWSGGTPTITRIGPITAGPGTSWRLYVDNVRQDEGPCATQLRDGDEVLFYVGCDGATQGCFSKEPSILTAPATVGPEQPFNVSAGHVRTIDTPGLPSLYSTEIAPFAIVLADGAPYAADDKGVAQLFFATRGPHQVTLSEPGRVPDTRTVCATTGHDGYCATTLQDPGQTPPFDVNDFPSECVTNGHDGLCGTTDTTGPAATVVSINKRRLYPRKRGPGQIKGTVEIDPVGIKTVRVKLTRTTTRTVVVRRAARKGARGGTRRARRVKVRRKSCTYWSDATALLERTKRCGMRGGRWWTPDLDADNGNQNWSYHFNLTLPRGRYVLQVQAQDQLGNWGPLARDHSVVVFVVR